MVKKKLQFDKTILLSYSTFKTNYKIMTIKNSKFVEPNLKSNPLDKGGMLFEALFNFEEEKSFLF